MKPQSLSSLNLLVLAALAENPTHAYGIRERIMTITLMQTQPHASSIRSALRRFEQAGWIRQAWQERGKASAHDRVIYDITPQGWALLREERQRLRFTSQWIDRLEARRRGLAMLRAA